MKSRKIVRLFSISRAMYFSGLDTPKDIQVCMVRHEGCSSNEFERIPDVLSSESRWTCA